MSKLLVHELTTADGALRLDGTLTGTPGDFSPDAKFTIHAIELTAKADENVVHLRAVLPKDVDIPAGLIDPGDPTKFKSAAVLKAQLTAELRALVRECFRRLETIEVKWTEGKFLGAAITVEGEAKLGLRALLIEDETAAKAVVVAAFRATMTASIGGQTRTYGVVCRCKFKAETPTLSLDLDDLNLSLPDLKLSTLDISAGVSLKVDLASQLAGVFSLLDRNFTLDATWDPLQPVFVVQPDGGRLLFAVMKASRDLTGNVTAADLAKLTAVLKHTSGLEVRVSEAMIAVHKTGDIATATVTVVNNNLVTLSGTHDLGPLRLSWENVRIGAAATASTPNELRVSVAFERLLIRPIDDPAAVIAFRGEIELTPSGVAVVELALVEPYPFVLVKRTAAVVARGVRKIVEIIGRIDPKTEGDVEGLRKLLEVLGRIAAAVARAAVFIAREAGEALASIAKLLAQAVVKVAELLAELLKQLAKLAKDAKPNLFAIDVEIRIALEPLELRQIVLSLPEVKGGNASVSALGFKLELHEQWRPVVLVDFVTEPGAYLCAIPTKTDATPLDLATLSTDLWLKRPGPDPDKAAVAAIRDGAGDKPDLARPDADGDPLVKVTAKAKRDSELLIVLAGMQRGQPVFFHKGTNKITRVVEIPGTGGSKIRVVEGVFKIAPLQESDIDVSLDFQKDRILPLLGMGEAGKETTSGDSFLDRLKKSLGQVVTVKKVKTPHISGRKLIEGGLVLEIQAAGVKTEATVGMEMSLDNFEVTFDAPSVFKLKSQRIEERALGLTWIVEQSVPEERLKNTSVDMFTLAFAGAETGFELNKDKARMEIRFDGLSSDGRGVAFEVSKFRIGRGGLDVEASVIDSAVRLNGLDVPFRFTKGRIEIAGGKVVEAVVAGRGQLPPQLVGDANCTVLLAFELVDGEIALKNGSKVELEKMGEPIICHSTRFTLTITNLELSFAREGGYHFYFLVTGSIRFAPKPSEFEDGLLQHFKDIEVSLERAPLTGDPRVLLKHVRFQKELKPKKTFSLFNIFTFELRGFGFHPASPKFEGKPALNISGQIRFADLGDVMQPKIDFHELWIAPPKDGESLPRIKAEGLGIELQLAGSVKIRGAVLAVDPDTRTVEGHEFAPDGYNTSGFLGEGAVDIPGLCAIEASMGFLEVEKQDQPGDRKKAFFLFLQADKLAVEIPTPIWTFYLREAGFGFGYRFTLAGIKDAERAKSTGELVRILDDVSKRQGDLARFSAWKPDPEKDNFTLALRGAFQPYPAKKKFDETAEKEAVSPFFFDIVAALRSDFTFLMSARGWLGVNYATFLANTDNFRERPMFRGYLYISVPRSELLLRAIADSKGFIGEDWPEIKKGPLREAVQSVDWTTTLYIRPGLFHYEMGWPDQLAVRLVDKPNMKVTVRGGMIFRAAEDGLLYGYNIGADAFMRFEGRVGGSIGVSIAAELNAKFVARVLAFLAANLRDSLVYGLVALDARLTFSVEAWMDVDLGFTSFTIRIGFSFSVQFTAAVELAVTPQGVGGRVDARIAVQVFGCSLSVGIGFTFNAGRLDDARARVQRFLSLSITSEEPDAPPVFGAAQGDHAIDTSANAATTVKEGVPPEVRKPKDDVPGDVKRFDFGRDLGPTDFWLVLRHASVGPHGAQLKESDDMAYALLVPREPTVSASSGFYAAPSQFDTPESLLPSETKEVHRIVSIQTFNGVQIWVPSRFEFLEFEPSVPIFARWNAPIPVSSGTETRFTLGFMFDECFLVDADWRKPGPVRRATKWAEPLELRIHGAQKPLTSSGETRNQDRELHQKAQSADAIASPYDERAYQARSTVMTMFLDQFVNLAATGDRTDVKVGQTLEAHVTDLGLVLYGPVAELQKLHDAKVVKSEIDTAHEGSVTILNPRANWYDRQDPILANDRSAIEADGIKLDWQLSVPGVVNAEQLLHHYEIVRTIEGFEFTPYVMNVKPAATIGKRGIDGTVALHAPDWQFIDNLSADTGVSATMRRALLPPFGEGEGLEAAKAWIQVFNRPEVTITYSVTPVDIAGVRGLPRSFIVDILRPKVPIRPAIGEVRVVQTIPEIATFDEGRGLERIFKVPTDLEVYLALKDAAWDDKSPVEMTVGDVTYDVERIYRLVLEPEDIEPAGHYGSDATTSRLRGPGAFAVTQKRGELKFDIDAKKATVLFNASDAARKKIQEIEPNLEERQKLPRWAYLGKTNLPGAQPAFKKRYEEFQRALWIREAKEAVDATRVATRFFLETVVKFKHPTDPLKSSEHVSKRVALPVEHTIIARDRQHFVDAIDAVDEQQSVATLRPEAFEWAVPLVMPPLGDGQVDAESGFVRFRVPTENARLADCQKPKTFELLRDPERRVLTTVRFAAVPDWVDNGDADKPLPLHGRSIAGFELFELDLDELAPLDSKGKLARDKDAWHRARRVARIEQLSREDARLVPHGNFDWQGWDAHYPSETHRARVARGDHRQGDSKPILAAWYSDRETTVHFAERRPRLRLLPLVPENAIAELMKNGRPNRITASLTITADSTLFKALINGKPFPTNVRLVPTTIGGARLDTRFKADDQGRFRCDPETIFSAVELRNLLLSLGWAAFDRGDAYLDMWLTDPTKFDGLVLELTADGSVTEKVTTRIELDLRSQVHPILEELLAELTLKNRGTADAPAFYRHYTVMPQPVVNLKAKNVEGFIANTATGTDPYGWQILQTLGLATTVRLYDLAAERFELPSKLTERVNSTLQCVLERWRGVYVKVSDAFGKESDAICGQVFAEVFLRPGADRLSGPFEAVIKGDLEAEKPTELVLDDDGLSFVQVSLRPRPVAVCMYVRQPLKWDAKKNANLLQAGKRLTNLSIQVERNGLDAEVARARGSVVLEVNEKVPVATFAIGATLRNESADDPALELYFRVDKTVDDNVFKTFRPQIKLIAEYETVETVDEKLQVTKSLRAIAAAESPLQVVGDWIVVPEPGAEIHPDPFDRFDAIPIAQWTQIYEGNPLAMASLAAFRTITTAFGYAFTNNSAVVNAFVAWSDRFLKNNVCRPPANEEHPNNAYLALCAPTKATPWRLVADREGYITLTFLHSDRWGHVRAYAVKPVARYQALLSGIGVIAQRQADPFVPEVGDLKSDVGFAVSVAPRTERIEPPVIMSSRLREKPDLVEIVVARHAEEALASSNRPLLAHTGVPASLLAFSRAYRTPDWPKRMERVFQPSGSPPHADLHPVSAAKEPVKPEKLEQITGDDIARLAGELPSLWKGADIWRIPPIPPHYRLIALASERAGIVVSDVTAVVQEEMPRDPLEGRADEVLPEKNVKLLVRREGDKRARLAVCHPLVSHAQLTLDGKNVFDNANDDDVAYWPDPDVRYVLARRVLRKDGTTDTEKEDADVRLVPAGPKDASAVPVVVRALGADYTNGEDPIITLTDTKPKNGFTLESSIRLHSVDRAWPLDENDFGTPGQIARFNDMAKFFAAILTPHAMSIDVPPLQNEKPDKYLERLDRFITALTQGVKDKLATTSDKWHRDLAQQATARIAGLTAWKGSVELSTQTADDLHAAAPLPIRLGTAWRPGDEFGDLLATGVNLGDPVVVPWTPRNALTDDPGTWLVIFDLASDDEVSAIVGGDVPPVAKSKGMLYTLLSDCILGAYTGFWIKAIDGRSRMIIEANHASAPGAVERRVSKDNLPACFANMEVLS